MKFTIVHTNFNVFDLDKSLAFYKEALGLTPVRSIDGDSFKIVYLGDGASAHKLELTWLAERTESYDLGDNEIHLAFTTPDYKAAYEKHKAMGCVCYENAKMGIYFIEDPDGYWLEVLPEKR